jgi:cellulose synthase/poly-beta-1,6-N-acetylglucosamine synthase-like glycosyltransferase
MTLRTGFFWGSVTGAGWVLVGYPLALGLLRARPWEQQDEVPTVTLLVPAYREREQLRRKLAALDDLDYPADRLQVLVTVDEDEELAGIAKRAYPRATVLFSRERAGKAAALNRGLAGSTGDIVVMTDANNLLDAGSIKAAVRHFADPGVVAVAGRRMESGSAYDRYEHFIRALETRSGSVAAMSGEFMGARRELVPPFPDDVINDDFWLLCHLVRQGGRVVYEPLAFSSEEAVPVKGEIARRSRMGAGRAMSLSELRGLPLGYAWRVLSHKYGRLALPFLLMTTLLSSLLLAGRRPYRLIAGAQAAAYASGALATVGVVPPGRAGTLMRAAGQFVLGNLAIARGVIRGVRGGQGTRWEPVR